MNASNNGSGAGVLTVLRQAARDLAIHYPEGDDARHNEMIAAIATIESAMALPGKWRGEAEGTRGCRQEHDADSAYDSALDRCADELEAILGPEPPATDAPEKVSAQHIGNLMTFAADAPRTYRDEPELPDAFDRDATPPAGGGDADIRQRAINLLAAGIAKPVDPKADEPATLSREAP